MPVYNASGYGSSPLTCVVHLARHGGTVEVPTVGEVNVSPDGAMVHVLSGPEVIDHLGFGTLLGALVELPQGVKL